MKRILPFIIICSALYAASVCAAPVLKFEVHGVSGEQLNNVVSRLKIERQNISAEPSATEIESFSHASIATVDSALAPYGYYKPIIKTQIKREGNNWRLIYDIQQGIPVRVKSINIKITGPGAENEKIQRFIKEFPLAVGDIFNSTIYISGRDKLFDVINNQGYIKADVRESKVLVDTDKHSADIKLTIDTRQRFYFGKMVFDNNAYDPNFLRRFGIAENEPFSSKKLLQHQQEMSGSRYFRQVTIIPDITDAEDVHVPLQASIVPINQRRYSFGLGYGTFTGPRFTAGVNFKRLTNTGQALDMQLKVSSILSGLGLKYYIPGFNPLTEQWILGANYQKFVPKHGSSHSQSLMFGYTRKMHHWQLATNMNYLWERYSVNNSPQRISQLLYPNLSLSYLKTDNVVRPTYGYSMNFMLQGATQQMLSSTSFLQGEVKGKAFMTPFSFGHVIVRGDLGYTAVHDLKDLPLSMRFFAGGMTSIRGYPDSSIGPGKYLGVASIEYRNHLIYDLSGAVFYDVGTATNNFGTSAQKNGPMINQGVGVGLVYESVIGPIKLYVAEAISKPGRPHSIEFALGPEF